MPAEAVARLDPSGRASIGVCHSARPQALPIRPAPGVALHPQAQVLTNIKPVTFVKRAARPLGRREVGRFVERQFQMSTCTPRPAIR